MKHKIAALVALLVGAACLLLPIAPASADSAIRDKDGKVVAKIEVLKSRTVTKAPRRLGVDCVNKSQIFSLRYIEKDGNKEKRLYMSSLLSLKHCGSYDHFNWVRYAIRNPGGNNGGFNRCGIIEGINLNHGAYGIWNPPAREFPCDGSYTGPTEVTVRKTVKPGNNDVISHASNDRSAALWGKVRLDLRKDLNARSKVKTLP